jgi:hypothetical protein
MAKTMDKAFVSQSTLFEASEEYAARFEPAYGTARV